MRPSEKRLLNSAASAGVSTRVIGFMMMGVGAVATRSMLAGSLSTARPVPGSIGVGPLAAGVFGAQAVTGATGVALGYVDEQPATTDATVAVLLWPGA